MTATAQAQDQAAATEQTSHGISLNWDLASLRVDAKIDWISIVLRLGWSSQQQHVRNLLEAQFGKSVYVRALADDGSNKPTEMPNDTTNVFRVRIQDPKSAAWTLSAVNAAFKDKQAPLSAADVGINALEVSIDIRSKEDPLPADRLATLVHDLCAYRDSFPLQDRRLRTAPGKKVAAKAGTVLYKEDILRLALQQLTFHSGHLKDGIAQRIYLKRNDSKSGEGAYAELPPDQHCARFETTLAGNHLPFKTLQEWREFKFESLRRKHFTWRIVESDPEVARMGSRRLLVPLTRPKPGPSRRKSLAGTKVDRPFAQQVKNALERLTRAQSRH